ncbi:MAG: 1-acyl-sn-glycerol-3-phosphate acyltransferase [Lachnospiraceae bacterium]|nr:1-acyl-sn-glycerol-3-phosphate acyltransferase [Lachnospiraceae bacterium]
MKIRTKALSYDEVVRLPSWKHRRPRKPSAFLAGVARLALGGELKKTGFSFEKTDMERAGDGPWLILMNHCSFTDLSIAFEVLKDRPFSIVCTSDALVGKESLVRSLGCIPTRKFVSDLSLISDIAYALNTNKASVLMFPEAGYSLDGTGTRLPKHFGIFLKKLKHPVVMITTFGSFTRDPLYNNLQKRDVTITCRMECLFTPEELAKTKVERIDEIVEKEFTLDYFKWQLDNRVEIDEPFRADGLNRILYKCPHCMTEGKTVGKGTTLTCENCGAAYEMDTLGRLNGINVETRFSHIPDWFAWEREQIREEIENGTYLLDVPCDIAVLKDSRALYMVGSGRLHHDCSGFVLEGCDGKLRYEQPPGVSYSVNSDYFWYEIGDIVSIGTNEGLYYCFPKEGDIVARTRLAAEELYKKATRRA